MPPVHYTFSRYQTLPRSFLEVPQGKREEEREWRAAEQRFLFATLGLTLLCTNTSGPGAEHSFCCTLPQWAVNHEWKAFGCFSYKRHTSPHVIRRTRRMNKFTSHICNP